MNFQQIAKICILLNSNFWEKLTFSFSLSVTERPMFLGNSISRRNWTHIKVGWRKLLSSEKKRQNHDC